MRTGERCDKKECAVDDVTDEIKTLRVAADLLFESGAVTTGRELLAIAAKVRNRPVPSCHACKGTGHRALAKHEVQVIAMLAAADAPVPTTEINRRLWPRVKGPAACNRLARMERDGLIVGALDEGNARAKVWTVRHG